MANDTKNACKYYTYHLESGLNCFNVSWTLTDFSKLEIDKEYVISPYRPSLCYLNLIFIKTSKYVGLYVKNRSSETVTSDITLNLFNENGIELTCMNAKGTSISSNDKTCLIHYYNSDLYKDPNLLPNDTLTFNLEFRLKQVQTWETFEEKYLNNYKTGKKLSNDLNKYILEKLPTVVTLKTKDAQIEANKAMLCARSSVFEKMFDNLMSEEEKNVVLIDDITGDTVKILVDFLKTDEVDLKETDSSTLNLNELYYAADKYDVQDLRNMCSAYILRGLTLENVNVTLMLAQKHSDDHMMKGCMIFIRRNIVSYMKSDGWKNLKTCYPDLGNEIFEFYVTGVTNSK